MFLVLRHKIILFQRCFIYLFNFQGCIYYYWLLPQSLFWFALHLDMWSYSFIQPNQSQTNCTNKTYSFKMQDNVALWSSSESFVYTNLCSFEEDLSYKVQIYFNFESQQRLKVWRYSYNKDTLEYCLFYFTLLYIIAFVYICVQSIK